jgi:hypothetical protein
MLASSDLTLLIAFKSMLKMPFMAYILSIEAVVSGTFHPDLCFMLSVSAFRTKGSVSWHARPAFWAHFHNIFPFFSSVTIFLFSFYLVPFLPFQSRSKMIMHYKQFKI